MVEFKTGAESNLGVFDYCHDYLATLSRGNIIGSGKTKEIVECMDGNDIVNDLVYMRNFDSISGGDGAKKDQIIGKAEYSTTITSNIYEYLNFKGIKTHFIKRINHTEMLVQKCDMIPLEVVYRFVNTGSYNKRQKHDGGRFQEGDVLTRPVFELFYKNDVLTKDGLWISDPLIKLDNHGIPVLGKNGLMVLQNPATGEILDVSEYMYPGNKGTPLSKLPRGKGIDSDHVMVKTAGGFKQKSVLKLTGSDNLNDVYVGYEFGEQIDVQDFRMHQLQTIQLAIMLKEQTEKIFNLLKAFYENVGVTLLDGKIEFGLNSQGELLLADVIDADSLRLREVLLYLDKSREVVLNNPLKHSLNDLKYKLVRAYYDIEEKLAFKKSINEEESRFVDFMRAKINYIDELKVYDGKKIKGIFYGLGLDKQGYREGEDIKVTASKYEKISHLTDISRIDLMKGSMMNMINGSSGDLADVLG